MDANERIKDLLNERGWTPYRLAKESGLPDATVSNCFRRNTMPTIPTLEAICKGFKITLAQFFSDGDMVEMSPELNELFKNWVNLTSDQKEAVLILLKSMNRK